MSTPSSTGDERQGTQPAVGEQTMGQLIGELSQDLSRLFRQEVELAKAEVRQEAGKAGRGAGMLSGAGVAGLLATIFLSLAVVLGLANVMDGGWAALIVGVLWALVGGALFATGRTQLRQVSARPEHTMESLKEDVEWARNQTR